MAAAEDSRPRAQTRQELVLRRRSRETSGLLRQPPPAPSPSPPIPPGRLLGSGQEPARPSLNASPAGHEQEQPLETSGRASGPDRPPSTHAGHRDSSLTPYSVCPLGGRQLPQLPNGVQEGRGCEWQPRRRQGPPESAQRPLGGGGQGLGPLKAPSPPLYRLGNGA